LTFFQSLEVRFLTGVNVGNDGSGNLGQFGAIWGNGSSTMTNL
jgi:hypothetical protein